MSSIDPSFGLIPLLPPGASVSPGGTQSEYGEHTSLVEGQDPQHREPLPRGPERPRSWRCRSPQDRPAPAHAARSFGGILKAKTRTSALSILAAPHEADAQ